MYSVLIAINGSVNCKPSKSTYPSVTHAIILYRPNGVHFTAVAGTTEFNKRWNPQAGDIVSFKHHGFLFASKKPKIPRLDRVRGDLNWDDVVQNWKEQKISIAGIDNLPHFYSVTYLAFQSSTESPTRRLRRKKSPKGFWQNIENRRRLFCAYASLMGFDPLDPRNWLGVKWEHLQAKNLRVGALQKDSLSKVLREAFPEISENDLKGQSSTFPPPTHSSHYLLPALFKLIVIGVIPPSAENSSMISLGLKDSRLRMQRSGNV